MDDHPSTGAIADRIAGGLWGLLVGDALGVPYEFKPPEVIPLKKERIKRRIYPNRETARFDVFDYIEMFYNPIRRHSYAGDVSPVEFEKRYAQSGT